jgi:hypothetical protein
MFLDLYTFESFINIVGEKQPNFNWRNWFIKANDWIISKNIKINCYSLLAKAHLETESRNSNLKMIKSNKKLF